MARKRRTTAEITVEIYFSINQLGLGLDICMAWKDICQTAVGKLSATLETAYLRSDVTTLRPYEVLARLDFRNVPMNHGQTCIASGFSLLRDVGIHYFRHFCL